MQEAVIVIHGLNLKPERMAEIERLCSERGLRPVRVELEGFRETDTLADCARVDADRWLTQVRQALNENKPVRGVVAYSLGALCYLCALAENDDLDFVLPQFQILLAPAIGLRVFASLLKPFLAMKRIVIPSAAHPRYRRYWGTPLGAYGALFELLERLENKVKQGFALHNQTVLFMNPNDELVSLGRVESLLGRMTGNRHETVLVKSRSAELKPRYNHLILDEWTLGKENFLELSALLGRMIQSSMRAEPDGSCIGGSKEH